MFTRGEIISILRACDPELKAATLFGINGGFGNTDCATLSLSAVHLDTAVIEYDRPKTGVRRVVPLWAETVTALQNIIDNRKLLDDEIVAKLVFVTTRGNPIVRQRISVTKDSDVTKVCNVDHFSDKFAVLLKGLDIYRPGLGFYTLRHTFRTWADETHDQHAIHRIMGHAIPGMSGIYIEEIELDRLRAVTDYVHNKLFGKPHGESITR